MVNERATKMLVLSAARTLFSEMGYENTTVEEICMLAGVAKGTFFYHFESKQYIVRHILAQQLDEFAMRLEEFMEEIEDAVEQTAVLMAAMIDLSGQKSETEGYFKNGLPEWYRTVEAQEKKRAVYPVLERTVELGVAQGSYKMKHPGVCATIAFLGIGQYLDEYVKEIDAAKKGIREFTAKTFGVRESALAL